MSSDPCVCDCNCHAEMFDGFILHVTACCHICPTCDQRIKTSVYDMYIKDCKTFHDVMNKAAESVIPELNEALIRQYDFDDAFDYTRE